MNIIIFWEGIKNKANNNIVSSDDIVSIDNNLLSTISEMLNKPITKDTKIFGLIEHKAMN